jgi:hypothetical protein
MMILLTTQIIAINEIIIDNALSTEMSTAGNLFFTASSLTHIYSYRKYYICYAFIFFATQFQMK